jgi:hypothetical protein
MTSNTPPAAPVKINVTGHFTVEEASRWLTCAQPVPLKLLQQLGRDCSMLSRIRSIEWSMRPTPHQRWPNERAYPADVIREVFLANPETAPYVPQVTT